MIAIGVLAIIGAALNWRIVSHSGKLLNRIFGDTIARAVYAAVGLVLIALGVGRMLAV
jgi:uncharacterized membrane protein YuzA (DUF378 family)